MQRVPGIPGPGRGVSGGVCGPYSCKEPGHRGARGPLSVPWEGVGLAPGPGVYFVPSRHLATLPCSGQGCPHMALDCGL